MTERHTDEPVHWLVMCEPAFLNALRRAAAGEDPDVLYAEFYANAESA